MEKPKKFNPHLRIVPKEKIEVEFEPNVDLAFFEKMENIDQISSGSRKNILDNLKQRLEQVEILDDYVGKDKVYKLTLLLKIHNQIYRFESNKEKKKEIEKAINQIEFAIRQRLLS